MSAFIAIMAGSQGCDDKIDAGTFTAPGNLRIAAIAIIADAEIANYKYDSMGGGEVTIDSKAWMGVTLEAAVGANSFIPLEHPAKSVEVTSGTVRFYFK